MTSLVKPREDLRLLRLDAGWSLGGSLLLLTVGVLWLSFRQVIPPGFVLQTLTVFAVTVALAFIFLPRHLPFQRFGLANQVTLFRALIVALFAGSLGWQSAAWQLSWWPAGLALLALALDGLDGWLARRRGQASPFGARFDMEVDAGFILVLSLLAFDLERAGYWVLLSGLLRYLFIAAGLVWPLLARPLPPSRRRQSICVFQILCLILCLTPTLAAGGSAQVAAGGNAQVAALVAGAGLAALALSFAYDTLWLLVRSPRRGDAS